ncbi:BAG family molecular chaperone regulator 8, chloroplastic [Phoenix dactylifera]|uniref:BAG family molecular chaperone regulator 8, chloroplastic n=1 Tax=Phoenix dactylifera TaxID=42345 RepID=A0A8B7BIN8_PHODC|nr:BAG family molecular chaperone regulator 8, chloroplastic [Phoenix dactylifera]
MLSPHHHHHQSHQCCCCCSCSSCCSSFSTPSLPPLLTSDQLLQALTTQLLLQSQSQSQSPSPSPPHIYTHHYLKSHQPFYQPPPPTHQQSKDHHHDHQTHPLLHSLLRRVAALECSLPHLSSPSPHPPPLSPPPPPRPQPSPASRPPSSSSSSSSYRPSLRDAAARTIQARFRLFLVRRSQTLRHLKRLASIKSHAAALRSSLSDQTARRDPRALSERAMDLLLQLDSIQSGDPMIREGKRSISRELVRILEFVDKVLVKEREMSLRAVEIAEMGTNGSDGFEGVARAPEYDGVLLQSTKPGKKVSFFENGRGSRASAGASEPFSEDYEEYSDHGIRRGHVERFGREVAGIRISEHSEPEERIHQPKGDERGSEVGSENGDRYGNGGKFCGQNGSLSGLSAPLPVQMERRRV